MASADRLDPSSVNITPQPPMIGSRRHSDETGSLREVLVQDPGVTPSTEPAGGRRTASYDDTSDLHRSVPRVALRSQFLESLRELAFGASDSMMASESTQFYVPEGKAGARVVLRDYPYHQSSGKLNISFALPKDAKRLFSHDLFHLLVSSPTKLLLFGVVVAYTTVVLAFALLYMLCDWSDATCHLGINNAPLTFHTAFAFAVETQATIGYGIPSKHNAFFAGCISVPLVVYSHSLVVFILNAVLIGGTLARLARANRRAVEVVFTDKACIQCVRDEFYFMFQVAELSYFRFHPAVEAHVRCYAVLHETDAEAKISFPFQTRTMRLTHPDDTRGAMLFLPVPSAVTHAIDAWSPLYPPSLARRRRRREERLDASAGQSVRELKRFPHLSGYSYPGLVMRGGDIDVLGWQRELSQLREAHAEAEAATGTLRRDQSVARALDSSSSSDSFGPLDLALARELSADQAAARNSPVPGGYGRRAAGDFDSRRSSFAMPAESRRCSLAVRTDSRQTSISMPPDAAARAAHLAAHGSAGVESGGTPADGGASGAISRSAERPAPQPAPQPARSGHTERPVPTERVQEEIRAHIKRSDLEVVVLLEAMDPQTSNAFQARHSYKLEDMLFDHQFESCMSFEPSGRARFDFHVFHKVRPCAFNRSTIGPMSSHS